MNRNPKRLQLKLHIDGRAWSCHAGEAGAGKFLKYFTGVLPERDPYWPTQSSELLALNAASRQVLKHYPGSVFTSVELNPEQVGAPIARLILARGGA